MLGAPWPSVEQVALEVCVTTCCGRDVRWLGELFSQEGWLIPRQRKRQITFSLPVLLGEHAHLHIYHKGGNDSQVEALLHSVRARAVHPQSVTATLLPNANGREAHTIAHHVAENWGQLAVVTTFVQGDMKADHMVPLVMLHDGLVEAKRAVGDRGGGVEGGATAAADGGLELATVRHLAAVMDAAAPSSGEACLCHASEVPPLLCEAGASSPDYREWPCPARFRQERVASRYQLMHLGGYTSLMGFVMRAFLREETWPAMPVPWCNAGSLSMTARQAREGRTAEWWRALRQLVERDRKVKWVSALRLAHVFERLWLRIFSGRPLDGAAATFDEAAVAAAAPAGGAAAGAVVPPTRRVYVRHRASSADGRDASDVHVRHAVLGLPACFQHANSTCCAHHHECCCPTRRHAPRY